MTSESQKPKILIVDDDPTLPALIQESDLMSMYNIISTQKSSDAVDLAKAEQPQVMILDYNMPEVNGLELCSRIKSEEMLKLIPIIFLTGITETQEMVKAYKMGAVDYILKPVVIDELAIKIQTRMELSQSHQRLQEYAVNMERLAQERAKQLIHADRLATLGTLSAGLAHEIKNPATFISGNIQTMERFWEIIQNLVHEAQNTHPDQQNQLKFILDEMPALFKGMKDGVSRIRKVVDSLKSFSRKESSDSKPVMISDCLANALLLCQKMLKNRVVVEETYSDKNIQIKADPQQIEQVLINLIVNAADAMEGRENSKIRFHITDEDAKAHILCEDNGPGMSQAMIQKIWEPFFTTKPAGKGTGLGLSICRSIVESHDGTIDVSNRPDGGLRFKITFPLYKEG